MISFLFSLMVGGHIQGMPDTDHKPLGHKGLYFYGEGRASGTRGEVVAGERVYISFTFDEPTDLVVEQSLVRQLKLAIPVAVLCLSLLTLAVFALDL